MKKKKNQQQISINIDEEAFNKQIVEQHNMGEMFFNMMADIGILDKKETKKFLSDMNKKCPLPLTKGDEEK